MARYKPAVPLYDKETFVEVTHTSIPDDGFGTECECWNWVDRYYPGGTRFDLFHGLQKFNVVRVSDDRLQAVPQA